MNETTILVIEDDKTIQNFMKISLKTRGYSYILADNGLSGISLFYANHPDLILLDLGLPDIDGMEVLKQIRKQSNTGHRCLCQGTGTGKNQCPGPGRGRLCNQALQRRGTSGPHPCGAAAQGLLCQQAGTGV